MKAVLLLGTLKREEPSNTGTLSEFFLGRLAKKGVECETIHLVNQHILPGTLSDMGRGDAWPAILQKLMDADIILLATPIWWGSHSSEMQKVVERLDSVHDGILAGKPSQLDNKVAGIIITGDSDGAEHVIGTLSNFLISIGVLVPPYATLSVLWDGHKKGGSKPKQELLKKYTEEYAGMADKMIEQILRYAERLTK